MNSQHYRIGLIGDHIATSLSPMIHSAEAAAQGLEDFDYELLDLSGQPDADQHINTLLTEYSAHGFTGFNVTHPYKQRVIKHLDDLTDAARTLGAVNNIIRTDAGWVGDNTDHSGFLGGLRARLPEDAPRRSAVLFGAGGAGAAVASALLNFGVQTLYVIDPQDAQLVQLETQLGANLSAGIRLITGGPEMADMWVPGADAVINATPIGMEHIPGVPFDVSLLHRGQWVADVIYRPVETQLLAAARTLGCATVDGTAMLVEQAADTFELQTGHSPDRARMREQLQHQLAAVN